MIKNIIFDAYGTLISTGDGSVKATEAIFYPHGLSETAAEIYREWKQYHRHHIDTLGEFVTEKEIFIRDLAKLYDKYHITSYAAVDVEPMIVSQYSRDLFLETRGVIDDLKLSYNIAIGSTTDTDPLMYNLNRAELRIDHVFTSESLRVYKPQKEFYKAILERIGWDAQDTLFVGDSLTDDVIGPKSVGMKAILLDRKGIYSKQKTHSEPDAVIQNLTQLIDIIPTIT
ncbi:MAG: HAD family hydrolase [Ruminococcaceae bacterium]|nr:HAD family hydrolase [Oscillospiraceae bacterium]